MLKLGFGAKYLKSGMENQVLHVIQQDFTYTLQEISHILTYPSILMKLF